MTKVTTINMLSLFMSEVTTLNNTLTLPLIAYLHDLLGGYVVSLFIAEVTTHPLGSNRPFKEGYHVFIETVCVLLSVL